MMYLESSYLTKSGSVFSFLRFRMSENDINVYVTHCCIICSFSNIMTQPPYNKGVEISHLLYFYT